MERSLLTDLTATTTRWIKAGLPENVRVPGIQDRQRRTAVLDSLFTVSRLCLTHDLAHPGSSAVDQRRAIDLGQRMVLGAKARLHPGNGGVTGGYYGGGSNPFDVRTCKVSDWAIFALKDGQHLSDATTPDDTQTQYDLLFGFLAAELATNHFSPIPTRGPGALTTLRLIAHVKGVSLESMADPFLPLLSELRTKLPEVMVKLSLDYGCSTISLKWDKEKQAYVFPN